MSTMLDKEDYEAIGGLKTAVESLGKSIDKLDNIVTTLESNVNNNYVKKSDNAKMEAKVDWLFGKAQFIFGALIAIQFILNFMQNGGLNSFK